jgi:UDP-N-acetylmuramate--alanine ligase
MTPQRTAHFVGIGGVGMSWLARLLLAQGWRVSGSDVSESPLVQRLAAEGAAIAVGHRAENLPLAAELVVYTAAAKEDNPELVAARARGLRVLKRAEYLGEVMQRYTSIAVAGTHGKTTTTALTGVALTAAGLDPTVMAGGEVPEFGGSTLRMGHSNLLVVEADEFDASFLRFHPQIAVVTNIEPEHLDFYGSFERVVASFAQFLGSAPPEGHVVVCLDDPVLSGLRSTQGLGLSSKLNTKYSDAGVALSPSALRTTSLVTYGFHPEADWQAQRVQPNAAGGHDFTAVRHGVEAGLFSLSVPGRHNVSNTLAALAVAGVLGVDISRVAPALNAFGGVNRRFQVLGEAAGVTVVDDYGHHPTEVRATLAAARTRYGGRRIRCVFQPHTYSRTKLLLDGFSDAFGDADHVTVTEIYAAREEPVWDITGAGLAAALNHQSVDFAATLTEAAERELAELRSGDVLLVMGAGDVYKVGRQVLGRLRESHGA